MADLIKKVQNTCFQYSLFKKGDKIVLGISGGPDSVCMLHIFSRLQKKYNLELIIAHVNYGLRGQDSNLDEKLVEDLAKKYNLKIFIKKITAPDLISKKQKKKDISEQNLRDIRYAFFEKIRSTNNFNFISIAHNTDDQTETYLMRVIRGAGLTGLSAILFKNKKIIRPLLATSRNEIMIYLKKNKLSWRLDKTNLEPNFLRNKIRHYLIPYLERKFNPNIKRTILNSVESISLDEDLLSTLTQKAYLSCATHSILKISKLKQLHPALQRRVLRQAIAQIKTNLKNISATHIQEILKIIQSTKSKSQVVIFKRLKISRKDDNLIIKLRHNKSIKKSN